VLGIQRQPDVNTLQLTRTLDTVFDDLQKTLPDGVRIERDVMRQADFIEVALGNLNGALRDGTLLVILVTVVFLANARAAGITLVAIPLSLVAAVIGLRLAGLSINSMTLGGLAIAIGALVDDAIIDVENILRRLRENAHRADGERRPLLDVVYLASREIRGSIVFATIIVMLSASLSRYARSRRDSFAGPCSSAISRRLRFRSRVFSGLGARPRNISTWTRFTTGSSEAQRTRRQRFFFAAACRARRANR
jgi:hypothetical protein